MKRIAFLAAVAALFVAIAAPAHADEQALTAREIQSAVDSYIASADQDVNFVGGPGSAGYDAGFWIRGGDFSLRINVTLQARYEWFQFDRGESTPGPNAAGGPIQPGGGRNLSGFSVPRAILKFSGTAPCNMRYYVELDFGHHGGGPQGNAYAGLSELTQVPTGPTAGGLANRNGFPLLGQSNNFDNTREAWIEWGCADAFNFRMGQIKIPTTRQLLTPPELQQFVDISMASSVTGTLLPGYTDRPRDHGAMLHGVFGCNNEWSYRLAVTNGDGGDSIRNVLNPLTSDNLMYSGRLNWAFLEPIGYTEGATRFNSCVWYGEAGIFGSYYRDNVDFPHTKLGNRLMVGGDVALGYGGFSATAAFNFFKFTNSELFLDEDWFLVLAQAGYLFPDTAWEIAARWSYYQRRITGGPRPRTNEIAGGINYYLNGHSNKITADFSYIIADSTNLGGYFDVYSGIPVGFGSANNSFLFRLQWQLAL